MLYAVKIFDCTRNDDHRGSILYPLFNRSNLVLGIKFRNPEAAEPSEAKPQGGQRQKTDSPPSPTNSTLEHRQAAGLLDGKANSGGILAFWVVFLPEKAKREEQSRRPHIRTVF